MIREKVQALFTKRLLEKLEHWEADELEGFLSFGLPESRAKTAVLIQPGDLVFVYVSTGVSAFSDVRRVRYQAKSFPRAFAKYGRPFALQIQTESVLALDRERWVPIKGLLDSLSFTRGKKAWAGLVRQALRRIEREDALLLADALVASGGGKHKALLTEIRGRSPRGAANA